MNIFFSYKQLLHNPPLEYFNGVEAPYPEVPQRAQRLLDYLLKDLRFRLLEPKEKSKFGECLLQVHDLIYLATLKEVSESASSPKIYFYDSDSSRQRLSPAGQELLKFCTDTITPIGFCTWESAYWSALSALNAAAMLRKGEKRSVFALTRPPGHHAGRASFGGYCYLNNAALAAEYLTHSGKTAILDFDYHHGNGTESIFYHRLRVLFVSLHCRPPLAYPYYTGSASAKGIGKGKGYNINLPLEPFCGLKNYRQTLNKALRYISDFSPRYLVISAGFDIFQGDQEDNFDLPLEFSQELGEKIARLKLPTLIVLEGGYNLKTLPELVYTFLLSFGRNI